METKVLRFTMFLLFLVIAADVAVKRTEGKDCWLPSMTFKGICIISKHCAKACLNEGFNGGKCKGFLPHCDCVYTCY
ncbi:hypothetical protein LR48_Vigan01g006800 [Vigna angularis]|uniref:Defensin-like protein n=2 Tax=Phaseolus angularis TaxID=3914 RepID=A0A0L9TK49_PHAAN|nr:Defensin-like protein [Vigna angularis]KOM30514.1 hypothetical protein LR48_Vigan01g006800 [Vigna angularis]BAT73192.1 hypothetical protein VIGAN_01065700 [Vigna angularis var. angularis]